MTEEDVAKFAKDEPDEDVASAVDYVVAPAGDVPSLGLFVSITKSDIQLWSVSMLEGRSPS